MYLLYGLDVEIYHQGLKNINKNVPKKAQKSFKQSIKKNNLNYPKNRIKIICNAFSDGSINRFKHANIG